MALPVSKIFKFSAGKSRLFSLQDSFDHLTGSLASKCLLGAAILVGATQATGGSIRCFTMDKHWKDFSAYAQLACLILGTQSFRNQNQRISYYVWICPLICVQALVFFLPHYVYRKYAVARLLKVYGIRSGEIDQHVTTHLLRSAMLKKNHRMQRPKFYRWYYALKLAMLAALVGQLFLAMNVFNLPDLRWGYTLRGSLFNDSMWKDTGLFPREVDCDIPYKRYCDKAKCKNAIVEGSLKCTLYLNVFFEKLFILEWWFFVVLIALWIFFAIPYVWLAVAGDWTRKALLADQTVSGGTSGGVPRRKLREVILYRLDHDALLVLKLLGLSQSEQTAVLHNVISGLPDEE